MTCRTSSINWLDCLYNAVRKTPGGVIEAAKWLTDRRGKSMHPETLRSKLNGTEGESVTIEIAELLTEWMQQKAGGSEYALEWMQALAGQFGMAVDLVPPAPEGGWPDEIAAVQLKLLEITTRVGISPVGGEGQCQSQWFRQHARRDDICRCGSCCNHAGLGI